MTRYNDRDCTDYTCPHCGDCIWDNDYRVQETYQEDDWYIEVVTCGCGAECTFSRRIDDYPSYVSWDDSNCERPSEEEHTEDIVQRPPVTYPDTPLGEAQRELAELQNQMRNTQTHEEFETSLVKYTQPRNSTKWTGEMLSLWRSKQEQLIREKYSDTKAQLQKDIERVSEKIDDLYEAEREEAGSPAPMKTTHIAIPHAGNIRNIYSALYDNM